tara:strand:- start:212 stop:454 length:243 start_codon:yes stop_codon:yes gene_type:complete
MYIINPQITIIKSGWFIRLFREYTIVFTYAVASTLPISTSSRRQRTYYALDHVDALRIVNKLKAANTGLTVHVHDETVED